MIYSDFHIHSCFSGDSDTPSESMAEKAIELGLKTICFTEHLDQDFPPEIGDFSLDTRSYFEEINRLKERYAGRLEILIGVELGMMAHVAGFNINYAKSNPFDFVIGSQHLLDREDPYYASYWSGKDAVSVVCHYFDETLKNLKAFTEYDSLGHLDYIVRYSKEALRSYSYLSYADYIDPILQHLIDHGKCLEINTAGLKYGTSHPNPHEDVLKRYRELGGELITIGSDGHKPEHLAYDFQLLPQMLTSLGFRYHTVFRERKPFQEPIEL